MSGDFFSVNSCFKAITFVSGFLKTANKARALRKHFIEIKEIITNPEKREVVLPALIFSFGAVFVQNAATEWWETRKISDFSIISISTVVIVVAAQVFVLCGRSAVERYQIRNPRSVPQSNRIILPNHSSSKPESENEPLANSFIPQDVFKSGIKIESCRPLIEQDS
jgi:hypothetical protein